MHQPIEAQPQSQLQLQLPTQLQTQHQLQLQPQLQAQFQPQVQAQHQQIQLQTQLQPQVQPPVQLQVQLQVQPQVQPQAQTSQLQVKKKSEKNNQILNELKVHYEQLKKLFDSPRLYMGNYFADLRSEIDIAFIKMNQNEQSIEVKHKLNDSWFQMIENVNTFETECFKLRSTNTFNLDFSQEVREKIELINIILNDLTNQIIAEENQINETSSQQQQQSSNDSDEDSFLETANLIYEEIYKIEKILMMNKTLVFLDKSNWTDTSLFDFMNNRISFGKLLCIQNEYFGSQSIGILKKYVIFTIN